MTTTASENTIFVRGCIEFARKRVVTHDDVRRAADLACRVRLPENRAITHARVLCFLVDAVMFFDPVGMECERLGVCVQLTSGEHFP
jgi:cell division ATPase FtsA